jgi:hypothetical protein
MYAPAPVPVPADLASAYDANEIGSTVLRAVRNKESWPTGARGTERYTTTADGLTVLTVMVVLSHAAPATLRIPNLKELWAV